MQYKYIIGNDIGDVIRIIGYLGIPGLSRGVTLSDYFPEQDEVPILISSSGLYHGDSLILSDKLSECIEIEYKVIIDRHSEFSLDSVPVGQQTLVSKIIPKSLQEKIASYGTHMREVWERGYLERMALLGLEDGQEKQVLDYFKGSIPKNVLVSNHLDKADKIGGCNLHITSDIDVISGISCVGRSDWKGDTGPTLDQVLEAIRTLIENNKLVAFDIVGLSIGNVDLTSGYIPENIKEGLECYQRILKVVTDSV